MDSLQLLRLLRNMYRRPAATQEAINSAESDLGVVFPEDYRRFLMETNGANGNPAGVAYVDLFPVEKLRAETLSYGLPKNFVLLGTDGGSEGVVLTMQDGRPTLGWLPLSSSDVMDFKRVGSSVVELMTKDPAYQPESPT